MQRVHSQAGKDGAGSDLYPLLLKPAYKDYIWGGAKIPAMFHRPPPPGLCAESWEVSDRPEGMSLVVNGRHAGKGLHELALTMGSALVGERASDVFPLLIKLIDARERLSVQVHPDDTTAARYGGEAKTEMWYVLDAEPDARVFAGLARGVTRAAFERALREERLEEVLQPVRAEVGKCIYIPGGRAHAIGEGCVILEVQQNSNTTYRLYDWGRVGSDGRPRDVHVEQALRCIRWRDRGAPASLPARLDRPGPNLWWEILKCPYFHVTRVDLMGPEEIRKDRRSFDVLFTLGGGVAIEHGRVLEIAGHGVSCLIPAAWTGYRLTPVSGTAVAIRIGRF